MVPLDGKYNMSNSTTGAVLVEANQICLIIFKRHYSFLR